MENIKSKILLRAFIFGIAGTSILLVFYLTLVSLVESWKHALQLFTDDMFYIIAISLGFGIQVGLYNYLKNVKVHLSKRSVTAVTATGTGTSSLSMLACCLHHLGDILPILGLSGAAIFFEKYRYPVMWSGIIMNLLGLYLMLRMIARNNLWPSKVFSNA